MRGVNLFIPHAFYYSIDGARKLERPPDVGPNSIWWAHYEKLAMYMRRLSFLMTDIQLHAPVAVLCRNRDLVPSSVRALYENQIGFRYLPQSEWDSCREVGGHLLHGEHRFTSVIGDDAQFASVLHGAVGIAEPDCTLNPAQPSLRVARFKKEEATCWLLVNEGEETIDCEVTFPSCEPLCAYDLFRGSIRRFEGNALHLPRRESLLVFTCAAQVPNERAAFTLPAPRFELAQERPEDIVKEYRASVHLTREQLSYGSAYITLDGEEMIELYVNGRLAHVLFWSPQAVDIWAYVHEGENELHAVVTGSLANRYGNRPVWYGLK